MIQKFNWPYLQLVIGHDNREIDQQGKSFSLSEILYFVFRVFQVSFRLSSHHFKINIYGC